VAISPQGDLIASGGHDGVLRLRHWETALQRTRCEGHANPILCVAFSPDGSLLATGAQDGTVRLWDQRSGKERRRFATPSAIPFAVVFSPDGHTLAATGNDGIVRLWEVATGEERCRFRRDGEQAALAFVRGGRVVVSAGRDSLIHFHDTATAKEFPPLPGHRGWAYALAVSPDGSTLASAGQDTTILLWSLARGAGDRPAGPASGSVP
jgi:WD40 repeat protein